MLDEIKARLSLPTPAFWKKVQKRTAAASAAFTTLTVTVATISDKLPPVLPTILACAAALFGGIAAICSLAVDDASQITPAVEPEEKMVTPNL
ncbi:hypothetical protein [Hymenobacter fodinae]|uniref:Uncharacterized protein n=1 Tax=Hymenobacter fodinae TaxID=2510796 RepID=A0A4Z0P299_9BACT|nr:hypothetical protein [Hymenobacter fodinae]TGE05542.1 hypothetical protein EU556_19775 [Hymenobacter fodinae]